MHTEEIQRAVARLIEASNTSGGITPPGNQTAASQVGHAMIQNAQIGGLVPKRLYRPDGSLFYSQDPLTKQRREIAGYDYPFN